MYFCSETVCLFIRSLAVIKKQYINYNKIIVIIITMSIWSRERNINVIVDWMHRQSLSLCEWVCARVFCAVWLSSFCMPASRKSFESQCVSGQRHSNWYECKLAFVYELISEFHVQTHTADAVHMCVSEYTQTHTRSTSARARTHTTRNQNWKRKCIYCLNYGYNTFTEMLSKSRFRQCVCVVSFLCVFVCLSSYNWTNSHIRFVHVCTHCVFYSTHFILVDIDTTHVGFYQHFVRLFEHLWWSHFFSGGW